MNIKQISIALLTLTALCTSTVKAEESGTYDWNGFYAGVNAGYASGEFYQYGTTGPNYFKYPLSGKLVGGSLGYNHVENNLLIGVEADVQLSGIFGEQTTNTIHWSCGSGINCSNTISAFGSVRAKLGFVVDNWATYTTGGVVLSHLKSTDGVPGAAPLCDTVNCFSVETADIGWTAGVGVETALTENMTLKTEVMYVDLGEYSPAPQGIDTFTTGNSFAIVRAGVNWKIGD